MFNVLVISLATTTNILFTVTAQRNQIFTIAVTETIVITTQ